MYGQVMTAVLVVDDDPDLRRMLHRLLQHFGCTVLLAADGPSALAVAEAHPFDLAIVDLHLPVMDGLQTARQLAVVRPEAVLALSTGSRQVGLDAMDGLVWFPKPYCMDDLEDLLARCQAARRPATAAAG